MSTTSASSAAFNGKDSEGRMGAKRRVIVLDTSVLLSDPDSIFAFDGCDIVLPLKVIEELDNHKSRTDDIGRAARQSARLLEELRLESADKGLRAPQDLGNGATLRIEQNGLRLDILKEKGLSTESADNRIIAAALGLKRENARVTIVSGDVNLRLKAAALELDAEEYIQAKEGIHDEKHPGWQELFVTKNIMDRVFKENWVAFDSLTEEEQDPLLDLNMNEYGVLKGPGGALVRRTERDGQAGIERVDRNRRNEAWGVRARSKEQAFALDLLLDPEIPIVGLSGRAGTGKTLLALAAGLEQTFEPRSKAYERIMILRPVVPVGNQDLGFLPGTLEEKLGPWMEAITDAMVALGTDVTYSRAQEQIAAWVTEGQLTLESVTYLRGRSLQNTFIIVDEAQNLEPLTLKTILTRVGAGSKVVLVGDVSQIDNPWTSAKSNAISVLADRFAGQSLFGHLVLTKGERSAVADLAADLL